MGKNTGELNSREHAAADKAVKVAEVAKLAKLAHRELSGADGRTDKALIVTAGSYYKVGTLVARSGMSVRGFAVLAEHGDAEAFKATEQAQPAKLSSYKRAHYIATACDAVGADVAEVVGTFIADVREAQRGGRNIEPTLSGFADYCAAGFSLPVPAAPAAPAAPLSFGARVAKFTDGMTTAELVELASMVNTMAKVRVAADKAAAAAAAAVKPVRSKGAPAAAA